MANWRLGNREKAGDLYTRAIAWMAEHAPDHALLAALRAEADEVMQ